ncbi:hypothetical protein EYC80_003117 [Monilinia laxa]|uniref:Uncharacterized protein n=1 Tax=Monilinia laxa TaxID=61186 RepID=A0A5N6KCR1_MONLA|nr:hypothetical protein EYC80_003117 [Monilinia laxa]
MQFLSTTSNSLRVILTIALLSLVTPAMSLSHVVNYPVSGPRPQSLSDQFANAEADSSSSGVHAELE